MLKTRVTEENQHSSNQVGVSAMSVIWYMSILAPVLLPASPFVTMFVITKTDDTNDNVCDADCFLREVVEGNETFLSLRIICGKSREFAF